MGNYPATFYSINGITLETRKRREHLSSDDLKKNKALLENFTKGNIETDGEELANRLRKKSLIRAYLPSGDDFPRKESLPPPPAHSVTWDEYISAPPGEHETLGRRQYMKESSKSFKATVAMSEEFPLSVDMLLNVLEVSRGRLKLYLLLDLRRFLLLHVEARLSFGLKVIYTLCP